MKKYLFGLFVALSMGLAAAAVNINTATVEQLETLPGIGPAKAKAIVDYRKQNGNFKKTEDLKNVKGIGEGIYGKVKGETAVTGVTEVKAAKPAVNSKAATKVAPAVKQPVTSTPGAQSAVKSSTNKPAAVPSKSASKVSKPAVNKVEVKKEVKK